MERRLEKLPAFLLRLFRAATDLDGPTWRTFLTIVRRPGALTKEYADRRFQFQVAPVRLYLFVAATWYFAFPIWNGLIPSPDGEAAVSFFDPAALALTVPLWAGVVWIALLGRRTLFEETFTFSAHFHVAYLLYFLVALLVLVGLGALGAPEQIMALPLIAAVSVFPGIYLFLGIRTAFGIRGVRLALTAGVLGIGHLFFVMLVQALLDELVS